MDLQRDLATFLGREKGFFILPLGTCPPTAHPAGGLEPEMPQWRDPELHNTLLFSSPPHTPHPADELELEQEPPQWRDPKLQNTASSTVHKTNWIWNSCFSLHKLHIRKSPNTPPGQVITATDWSRAFQSSQKRGESFSFLFRVLEIIQSRAVDPPFFCGFGSSCSSQCGSGSSCFFNEDPDPA